MLAARHHMNSSGSTAGGGDWAPTAAGCSSRHHSATITCGHNGQPSSPSAAGLSLTRASATRRQKHFRAAICSPGVSSQDHIQDAHSQGGVGFTVGWLFGFPAPTKSTQLAHATAWCCWGCSQLGACDGSGYVHGHWRQVHGAVRVLRDCVSAVVLGTSSCDVWRHISCQCAALLHRMTFAANRCIWVTSGCGQLLCCLTLSSFCNDQ